jgi:WD40 repeat protein
MGSTDKSISLWNTNGELIFEFIGENCHSGWVTCIQFNREDENLAVSCSLDGTLRVWDLEKKELVAKYFCGILVKEQMPKNYENDGSFGIRALTLTSHGSMCGYGGNDNKVYIINLEHKEGVAVFETDSTVTALSFCPTHAFIACGTKNSVYLWNVVKEEELQVIDLSVYEGNVRCTAMTWTNEKLLVGLSDGKIVVFDLIV